MTSGNTVENEHIEKPLRDYLYIHDKDGNPQLVLSKCKICNSTVYPKESICPKCIKEGVMEEVHSNGDGKIVSFTQVMRGLPGYDSPYILASIELNDGPVLIAQIENEKDILLKTNTKVELLIGQIYREDKQCTVVGPKFKPLD